MKMNPEEITAIIKEQIKNYEVDLEIDEVGTVIEIGDGIAHIHGLQKAMAGELLDFGDDIFGMVLNLEQDNVGAVLLGDSGAIREGDTVICKDGQSHALTNVEAEDCIVMALILFK